MRADAQFELRSAANRGILPTTHIAASSRLRAAVQGSAHVARLSQTADLAPLPFSGRALLSEIDKWVRTLLSGNDGQLVCKLDNCPISGHDQPSSCSDDCGDREAKLARVGPVCTRPT